MPVRGPTPTFAPIADVKGYVSVPWQQWFGQLNSAVFPDGITGVVDGSLPTTGNPSIIFQDYIANQPDPAKQYIFFSLDTGAIYTVNNNGDWQLQSPAFTGDVTKMAFSTITTLSPTGVVEGTYENATVTVDSKGRITSIEAGAPDEPFVWPVSNFGDLIVGVSAGVVQNLAMGTIGQVLTVLDDTDYGLGWVSPTGGNETVFGFDSAVSVPDAETSVPICAAPTGFLVEKIEVIIFEPFDVLTELNVGLYNIFDPENPLPITFTSLMDENYFNTAIVGSYETSLAHFITEDSVAAIQVISAASGTTGRGVVRVTLSSMSVDTPTPPPP